MAIQQITCPNCNSKIKFNEGDIIEKCVSCQTLFQVPGMVKVKAQPNATVVMVEPVGINSSVQGVN